MTRSHDSRCTRQPAQARRVPRALPGLGPRAARRRGVPAGGRRTYVDNARIKARYGRGRRPGRPLDARRRLGDRGRRARRRARRAHRALGRGPPRREAARGARRARRPRARYVCELVALAPDGDEVRGTGVLEGDDRARAGAATRASASTRSSSRAARRRPSRSSATAGRRSTRTARRAARCDASRSRSRRVSLTAGVGERARCRATSSPRRRARSRSPSRRARRAAPPGRRASAAPGCASRCRTYTGSSWNVASRITAAVTAPGSTSRSVRSTFVST